ncbi:MAG: hypothetical protein Q4B43_07770 [Bacteroidota bacterium]|nr:hypothetical protein [Bacteroidota bacterium]
MAGDYRKKAGSPRKVSGVCRNMAGSILKTTGLCRMVAGDTRKVAGSSRKEKLFCRKSHFLVAKPQKPLRQCSAKGRRKKAEKKRLD